jgi:uncharacterized protein
MRQFAAAPVHLTLALFAVLPLLACTTSPASPPGEASSERPRRDRGARLQEQGRSADLLPAEIATVGWDSLTNSPLVLLRELGTGQVVPIWVGVAEGQAIAAGLNEIPFPRPMTHDLMSTLLRHLGADLEEVLIHDLVNGTYLGLLKLRPISGAEPILIDTRPSDGLALAVRTGAAIRVHRKLLEETPDYDFLPPEADEQVVRSLGLTVVAVTAELRREHGLPEREGVLVTRASGESARAGLRRGDLILEVNGQTPVEPIEFLDALRESPFGDPVRLRYWRKGAEHEVEVLPAAPEVPRRRGREVVV